MKLTFYIIVFLFLIFVAQNAYSAKNIETKLIVKTDNGEVVDKLAFGTNENATYWLDEDLGEQDLPPPPPSRLFPVFMFMNYDSAYPITSFKDFQPPITYAGESRTFSLRIFREAGSQVSFQWEEMDNRIDSAFLIDETSLGATIKLNMKKTTSGVGNLYLDKYLILAWYHYSPSSIDDFLYNKDNLEVFPNPVYDKLEVRSNFDNYEYRLSDSYGRIIYNNISIGKEVALDLKNFANGVYFLYIKNGKNAYFRKIMKSE